MKVSRVLRDEVSFEVPRGAVDERVGVHARATVTLVAADARKLMWELKRVLEEDA